MFKGEDHQHGGYPSQTPNGEWKVRVGSEEYRAWKYWLGEAFGKLFFPEPVMVVWFKWPPQTPETASEVASIISGVRDDTFRNEKRPIGGRPVAKNPLAWNGYIPPAPSDDGRKHASELKPWRKILRDNGRPIPRDDGPTAKALDAMQKRPAWSDEVSG